MVIRLLCAVLAGLLLAAAFPLSIAELPLGSWGPVAVGIPGWNPDAGYGQVAWFAFIALIPMLEAARSSRSDFEACCLGYLTGMIWLSLNWLWLGSFGWLPVISTPRARYSVGMSRAAMIVGVRSGIRGLVYRRAALICLHFARCILKSSMP